MELQEQIKLLISRLTKKIDIKKIMLFGSYAYGNPTKESDIDLCIITDIKDKRKIEIIREIRKELITFIFSPLDILVYSEKEFKERSFIKNTLEYKIMNSGIKIYG